MSLNIYIHVYTCIQQSSAHFYQISKVKKRKKETILIWSYQPSDKNDNSYWDKMPIIPWWNFRVKKPFL